ncbi:leucine repeat adapter protein 25-like isoform X2 [Coccinella septempunctata]|nr:leucine repeat adapter protein 25-like isoform X2 [Coccinella septempunctata]XP_044748238.1 leucine repeat adapter protein 25-like isoform X2 [Coccinella septempunctata]XP_044748240.1 leucine repeat adapter protein 25-like isoform X2 [Coccinella septempunctata]
MSSLHGLPPLPKSLSGFNLDENYSNPSTPARTSSTRSHQGVPVPFVSGHLGYHHHKGVNGASESSSTGQVRKSTNLDAQLAILKREMYSLRQLDLSLLSQLWSLNESIQDFRQILQDQEDCRVLSPPSLSPSPSSDDEGDCDEQFYMNAPSATPSVKFRPAPPPPPIRKSSNSSNASTCG